MTKLIRQLADKKQKDQCLELDGRKVKVSHFDKIFWPASPAGGPKEKYTKGDLIKYYQKIASYILPYLKDRPESLHRFPDGIRGENFYQKNVENLRERWLKTVNIPEEGGDDVHYLIANDTATIIYMINLGCIELNPWNSRLGHLQKPDYLVIDLDPEKVSFDKVVKTALAVKKILDQAEITGFLKTSGLKGLHIYIPMGTKYTYNQVRNFAEIIVNLAHQKNPRITSLERLPEKRQGKVYLDYLQNAEGQTLAAPYSVRPILGANVSAPLLWQELEKNFKPEDFNMKNIFGRIKKIGDPFSGVLKRGIDLKKALKKLES